MAPSTRLPLHDIRIVDLSTVVSGPLATRMLADQGADVVKVEAPGSGDLTRDVTSHRGGMTALYAACNRGKRAITLDLRDERGREVLHRLVATADAVVQNFRPGVVERLGVGYDDLVAVSPNLVYLSISGFGFEGPMSGLPVYDNLIQAGAGLAALQTDATGRPTLVRNLVLDKITALTAAQALTSALLGRRVDGEGRHVRVSMLDAAISFLWVDGATDVALLEEDVTHLPTPVGDTTITEFADGYGTVAAVSDDHFRSLCDVYGCPEIAADPRWDTLAKRFADPGYRELMRDRIMPRAKALPVRETIARLQAAGVGAAEIVSLAELPEHPQAVANDTFVVSTHPAAGRLREPRPAARSTTDGSADPAGPAPLSGEHTDAVLAELGYAPVEVTALRSAGVVA
ncbi:MAG: CoA transferase [Acidimicrobiales bacterium]|nr:CoA transferase [Acidimicrobiales bacterium]